MNAKNQIILLTMLLSFIFTTTLRAQGTTFTYQGRVTDNGTNFTGLGQFKFALVTGTNANHTATATAGISGGFVTAYVMIFGGNGYVTAPVVTVFGGGGSGATATATISGGVVTGITADNPGSGYTSVPTVLIAPPPPDISYTTYWSNDGTGVGGSEPNGAVNVPVANGLFTVVLGDTTQPNMTAFDAALFNQPNLQLRTWFSDGVSGFAALNPAQNLTPAPYAVMADSAKYLPGLMVQQNNSGAPNVIGGASVNFARNGKVGATIGGGGATNYNGHSYTNRVTDDFGTVGGGFGNAAGYAGFVGGGLANTAGNLYSTVGGGGDNTASGNHATVGGGGGNVAGGYDATVGGGNNNTASGDNATVGGGSDNTASGDDATVPGGFENVASGLNSFAAGDQAQATHYGAFVWSDSQVGTFSSSTDNEFSIRAQNGVRIQSDTGIHLNAADEPLIVRDWAPFDASAPAGKAGIGRWGLFMEPRYLTLGIPAVTDRHFQVVKYNIDGTYTPLMSLDQSGNLRATGSVYANGVLLTSDRNAKEDFAPLDVQTVLAKVAALPMTEWNYKADSPAQKHIGPMAQDFHAAFGLNGSDDKHISVVDEGGVALAAIQGLNQKLQKESKANDTEIQQLRQAVARLTGLVNQLAEQQKRDKQ